MYRRIKRKGKIYVRRDYGDSLFHEFHNPEMTWNQAKEIAYNMNIALLQGRREDEDMEKVDFEKLKSSLPLSKNMHFDFSGMGIKE
jgi:hypothetical protein